MFEPKKLKFYAGYESFSRAGYQKALKEKFAKHIFLERADYYPSYNYFYSVNYVLNFLLISFEIDKSLLLENYEPSFLLYGFYKVFLFWYWLPNSLADLKQYYPYFNIEFAQEEFHFLDHWIQILPLFEDFLGHLLINDKPLLTPYSSEITLPYVGHLYITMNAPTKDSLDLSAHLEAYYFGEGSHPAFLEVISLYLENRLELKQCCLVAGAADKASNKKVSNNLAIYFVCNFLTKGLSGNTLKFVLANTPLTNKRPLKVSQDADKQYYESGPQEKRARIRAFSEKDIIRLREGRKPDGCL